MSYRIGLDIGLTTVGWAAIENDACGLPKGILKMGARVFDPIEKGDRQRRSKERQKIRNSRRRIRRRKNRLIRTKELISQFNIISKKELGELYTKKSEKDIYKIRYEALDRLLYNDEWAQLLIHLMHKRGEIERRGFFPLTANWPGTSELSINNEGSANEYRIPDNSPASNGYIGKKNTAINRNNLANITIFNSDFNCCNIITPNNSLTGRIPDYGEIFSAEDGKNGFPANKDSRSGKNNAPAYRAQLANIVNCKTDAVIAANKYLNGKITPAINQAYPFDVNSVSENEEVRSGTSSFPSKNTQGVFVKNSFPANEDNLSGRKSYLSDKTDDFGINYYPAVNIQGGRYGTNSFPANKGAGGNILKIRAFFGKKTVDSFAANPIGGLPDEFILNPYFIDEETETGAEKDYAEYERSYEKTQLDYERMLKDGTYRTVGEMFYRDETFRTETAGRIYINIKNKYNGYKFIAPRKLLIEEIKEIFRQQRRRGNLCADDRLEKRYLEIFTGQRDYEAGPGETSPYSNRRIIWGVCPVYNNLHAAPKACYYNELASFLNNINLVEIKTKDGTRRLNNSERTALIELAHNKSEIEIGDMTRITGEPVINILKKNRQYSRITALVSYHKIKAAISSAEGNLTSLLVPDAVNAISGILSIYKSELARNIELSRLGIEKNIIAALQPLTFNRKGYFSEKALKEMLPLLAGGMTFSEAMSVKVVTCKNKKNQKLSILDCKSPINTAYKRSLSQAIKILNAVIRTYGRPKKIQIGFGTDMRYSEEERRQREDNHKASLLQNKIALEFIKKNLGIQPAGNDVIKYRLWKEQKGMCFYSGKRITLNEVFASNACEIDHIVPYSKSFDDSLSNKLLVRKSENKNKSNKSAFDFVKQDREKFLRFCHLVNGIIIDKKKRGNLLKERHFCNVTVNHESRYVFNILRDLLINSVKFESRKASARNVLEINLPVTDYVKKHYSADGDVSAAVNAVINGVCDKEYNKKVTKHLNLLDKSEQIEFPTPWEGFESELTEKAGRVFVSRMPKRKTTGRAHKDTIKSKAAEGFAVVKVNLSRLKIDGNSGELDNYYKPETDSLLYNALKNRLKQFENDAELAFIEPFYKPKADGTKGPVVKKVKLMEKTTLGVSVRNRRGIAANGNMVRIDIFKNNDKYYFIPIYVSDTVKNSLPQRAVIAHKNYSEWLYMNDKDFLFSLYSNELVKITHRKELKMKNKKTGETLTAAGPQLLYYLGANISTGTINMITHDGRYQINGLGIKTLAGFEKVAVDPLGNYYTEKIPQIRQPFKKKNCGLIRL